MFGDHIKTLFIFFIIISCFGAQAQITDIENYFSYNDEKNASETFIKWFPDKSFFPKLYADGTAQQFSLNKNLLSRRFIGAIGGLQKLAEFEILENDIQASLGATVYASLFRKSDVLEVHTACFFVDFLIDIKLSENFILRTGYGHYSAHLVDDGLEKLQIKAINYAKDYIPLIGAYRFNSTPLWLYGGLRFDTFTIPEYNKRWNIQIGIEYADLQLTNDLKLYSAVDLKFKSEASWGSTQSYQIGIKFLESYDHAFRFAYTYRTGLDDRGQFYKNHTKLSMLGLYFDF